MASKMDLEELLSFEEMLIKEDIGRGADYKKTMKMLSQQVYSLLDDSYIFLLNGKIYKSQ